MKAFPDYYKGSRAQFGFYAMRAKNNSFLITARGSDKKNFDENELVFVERVENGVVNLISTGKKASLNANVAARLFEKRQDVNLLLHDHYEVGWKPSTRVDFSPGTLEDEREVLSQIGNSNCIRLENHGFIVLAEDFQKLDDLVPYHFYNAMRNWGDAGY